MVVIFICLAAFAACLALVNQERRYRHERETLHNARERWEASTGKEGADSGLHTNSMVGLFADAIINQISVGEASELAQRTDESHASTVLANTLLSLLLIAGLAGTLFAFKDALGEPPSTGKNGGTINVDAIQKYALGVYGGIRGAFLPSVVGILSTILLYFYRGVYVHPSRDRFFVELESFGHRLAKAASREVPTNELALLAASQKISEAATKIQFAADAVKAAFQGAAEIGDKLGDATKNLQAAATQLEQPAASFLKAFDGNKSPVARRLGTLATAIERFEKSSEKDRAALSENTSAIEQAIEGVKTHVETISTVIARLDVLTKEQHDGAKKLDLVVSNLGAGTALQQTAFTQTTQNLGAAIEAQARQAGEVMTQMQTSLTAAQHEIVTAIAAAGQQQTSILDSTSKTLAEAGNGIAAMADRVIGVTEVLASSMTGLSNLPASLEHLPALNEQLRHTLQEIQKGAAIEAQARQAGEVMTQMQTSLTAAQHEIVTAIAAAGQQQTSILDSTSKALAEAGNGIAAMADRVVGVTEVLASSMTGLSNLPASLEHLPALNEQLRHTLHELQNGAAIASRQLTMIANKMAEENLLGTPSVETSPVGKPGKVARMVRKFTFWKHDK